MNFEPVMDAEEVAQYVSEVFPQSDQYGFEVVDLLPGTMKVSMSINQSHLRPGGTVSGPSMFALADCAAYLITLAHVGKVALAVTTNLNINFLSKPVGDLFAEARLLKLGKRLSVCDIAIFAEKDQRLVAHATATYSLPPGA